MDECKPLVAGACFRCARGEGFECGGDALEEGFGLVCPGQGLTLVHFSAQLEPFWSHLPVSLSIRLGENHALNVSHKMCLH